MSQELQDGDGTVLLYSFTPAELEEHDTGVRAAAARRWAGLIRTEAGTRSSSSVWASGMRAAAALIEQDGQR